MAKSSSPKKPLKNASPVALAPEPIVSAPAKASSKPKTVPSKATEPAPMPVAEIKAPVATEPETASKKDKKKKEKEEKVDKKVKIELTKPVAVKKKTTVAPKAKKELPPPSEPPAKGRRILFVTAECTPLAQTGGLGDAVAGLSKALLHRGHDVRIVMPLYGRIDRHRYNITFSRTCCLHFGRGEEIWVGIHEGKLDDQVPIWFIDYGRYFDRHEIYSNEEDGYRFGVLCKAALQVCKDVNWIPHVAHVHDWMTAIAAVFLKTWDRVLSPLSSTASVLTIHNIGYQGQFDPSVLGFYGFGADYLSPDKFEDHGAINLLKAGIQYSDMITTVSPTYAHEIRGPIGGMGMGMYLNDRGSRVTGILNGVDTSVWNPATDRFLPAHFSKDNLAGKAECKRALQERFGLTVDPKVPIFAVISRFAPQKGFDLMRGSLPQALRDMHIQVVVLGTGDSFTEHFFRWLAEAYPGRANAHIGFAPEVAHLIEAGSDFFIMPSIYEPCGLNQMYSSLYGTLPIVRATGGLDDTIDNYDEATGHGTGFKFWDISGRALFYTLGWANATWWDRPHHIKQMQQAGMSKDFTWQASAEKYEQVYEDAIKYRNS
jgi:starch synthase